MICIKRIYWGDDKLNEVTIFMIVVGIVLTISFIIQYIKDRAAFKKNIFKFIVFISLVILIYNWNPNSKLVALIPSFVLLCMIILDFFIRKRKSE